MRVICIKNKFKDIPTQVYEGLYGFTCNSSIPIDIGHISIVYAMRTINRNIWFLVFSKDLIYPRYYPNHFFEIIDPKLSMYWTSKMILDEYDDNNRGIIIGFKEIIENEFFLGELFEDDPIVTKTFDKYKNLMEKE
jgi:hypothetical protein